MAKIDRFTLQAARSYEVKVLRRFLGLDVDEEYLYSWRNEISGEFFLWLLEDGRMPKKLWKKLKGAEVWSWSNDLMWAWHEGWKPEPVCFHDDELSIPVRTLDEVLPRLPEGERQEMEEARDPRSLVYIPGGDRGDGFWALR